MKKRFKDLRRRGLALFLALTLCMSLTLTAFADEGETTGTGDTPTTTQTESTSGDDRSDTSNESAASETTDTAAATDTATATTESTSQSEDRGEGDGGSTADTPDESTVSVTVDTDTAAQEPASQAENAGVDNGDGTTTVTDITQDVWDTEDGTGRSETTTSVTTDTEGKVVEETTHVTGSETSKESSGETTSEESGVGNVSVTVTPGENGEGTADADAILGSLRPDTSGEGWSQNEDGSFSKTEDTENGQCVTTVTDVKDESGKTIGYTTQTVTTTVETTPTAFEAPEEGVKENEDGSRTTVTVERDENGVVTGYTEVTEVLNEAGVVVSSVTKSVSGSGTSTVTTTTTASKTQTVDPDTSSKVTVDMSEVTEGDKHGGLHTNGLEITDKPEEGNDLVDPAGEEGVVNLEDLKDDDLVFVSGIGLVTKYDLTIMYTQNKNGGWYKYSKGWPVKQYVVKDKDGNEHPVYCADMSVVTENDVKYYLENTEDADYYTNPNNGQKDPDGGWHLREIATNGYWGTEEGMGSLSELVTKLLAAKEAGNLALTSLSEEQIQHLTKGQALAATQAAIWKYGNSLGANPLALYNGNLTEAASKNSKLEYDPATGILKRITTTYDKETGKTTITTEEKKIMLPDGEKVTVERDPETGEIVSITYPQYYPAYIKLLPDGWLNLPYHSLVGGYEHKKGDEDVQLIEAVYKYLTTLEQQEDTTTDLIQPSDIVEAVTNVKTAVGKDGNDRDVYDADVSFVLTVEQSRLNGDLLVHVYDSATGALITTRRVAGDGSKDDPSIGKTVAHVSEDGKSTTYTIDGIQLANGQTVRINLVGSQEVKKGAYLITAQTGYKNNQTFVGVEEGFRDVDLNFELTLHVAPGVVASVESKEVASERTWDEDKKVVYNYYELDIPDRPTPEPTPDPRPGNPGTSTRRDRDRSTTTIPNEPAPLADIPEAEVPLASIPNEDVPLAVLLDEDVPLASVPKTGDISSLWFALLALSGIGLFGMAAINGKKSKESANG